MYTVRCDTVNKAGFRSGSTLGNKFQRCTFGLFPAKRWQHVDLNHGLNYNGWMLIKSAKEDNSRLAAFSLKSWRNVFSIWTSKLDKMSQISWYYMHISYYNTVLLWRGWRMYLGKLSTFFPHIKTFVHAAFGLLCQNHFDFIVPPKSWIVYKFCFSIETVRFLFSIDYANRQIFEAFLASKTVLSSFYSYR